MERATGGLPGRRRRTGPERPTPPVPGEGSAATAPCAVPPDASFAGLAAFAAAGREPAADRAPAPGTGPGEHRTGHRTEHRTDGSDRSS